MVAATSVLVLAAGAIDQLGLLNGVLALLLVSAANRALPLYQDVLWPSEPLGLASAATALALPVLTTWVVLVRSKRGRKDEKPWLSLPASSAQPVAGALALLAFPSTLANLDLPGAEWLQDFCSGPHRFELTLVLGALLTLAFAFALQEPWRVAHVVQRIGDESAASTAAARAALYRSLLPTLLFTVALLASEELAILNGLPSHVTATLALGAALLFDATETLSLQRDQGSWVCVWEERRPYAVPALLAAAQSEGLALRATAVGQTSLLRFFGPYASIRLWCAAADVERARELLRERLSRANEPLPKTPAQPLPEATATPRATAAAAGWKRAETWILGALCALPLLLIWLLTSAPALLSPPVRARFELVLVHDVDVDPFSSAANAELPAGVALFKEVLRHLEEEDEHRYFARLVPQGAETLEQAVERLRPWLATLPLPAGARIGWQVDEASDENGGEPSIESWRSYVLYGAPIVTTRDVESVTPVSREYGAALGIRFTPDAGERFRIATRDHVRQRMAIVINGHIRSAPLIMQEIRGGMVEISLGTDPKASRDEADALLKELRAAPGDGAPAQ
jgi:hypothetical protein